MESLTLIAGKTFSKLIELQKALVQHYIKIEGLPEYPVDLDTRQGQKTLKSFAHRCIEELAEGFSELEIALELVETNKKNEAQEYIRLYNVEIADAIHFLFELCIYSNMEEEEVKQMLYGQLEGLGLEGIIKEDDLIQTLLRLGNYLNQQQDLKLNTSGQWFIFSELEVMSDVKILGARLLSHKSMDIHCRLLWGITYCLNKAMNCLNNRDHHQTEKKVNEVNYKYLLVQALIIIFQYLEFAGINEQSLFASYYDKNQKNWERIKNNY